jgi:predicted DNA-binding protein (UPF0251 family)/predicted Fe-Mo cluster-binding NifX family protein
MPDVTYFKPAGIPLRVLEEIDLSIEEAEALRLKDLEGLEQEQGAEKMNISRPTFQRVLATARKKVADALLNGKAIKIGGGNFEVACPLLADSSSNNKKEKMIMKIAVITDDGNNISQHFGRAQSYIVLNVENGKVSARKTRPKAGHQNFHGQPHQEAGQGQRHGYDAGSQARHAGMADTIADCQVLLAGGMGWGAYDSLKSRGIETIITDVTGVDEAVRLYLEGKLPNLKERLH